jgi:hypothetical protein
MTAKYPKKDSEPKSEPKQKQNKALKRAYAKVASTAAGRLVFRSIADAAGWGKRSMVLNSEVEINTQASLHNMTREDFYKEIRNQIPQEYLYEIEKEETSDDD